MAGGRREPGGIIYSLCIQGTSILLKVKWKSISRVQLFATPWTAAPNRLLCPWASSCKNTGVGSHSLLQGIFLTQRSNPGHQFTVLA